MSAIAERKRLEAELAEAQESLQNDYYERSVDNKSDSLDKELESFEEEKNKEIEKLEEWLKDTEAVVEESFKTVQNNAGTVFETLKSIANEYKLNLSDAIIGPWKEGASAIDDYTKKFGDSKSGTTDKLNDIKSDWEKDVNDAQKQANDDVKKQDETNSKIQEAEKTPPPPPPKPTPKPPTSSSSGTIRVGGKINAGSAQIYDYAGDKSGERQYFRKDPIYTVLQQKGNWLQVRHHKLSRGITGWFKKGDVKAYAKGTLGTEQDELAWIDEFGEELVLRPNGNGKLSYLTKGTSVLPSDISANLMELGQLDPSDILQRSKPTATVPSSIVNNNMELNLNVGEVVHIDKVDNNTLPDLTKAVEKQMDSYMAKVNGALRRFSR